MQETVTRPSDLELLLPPDHKVDVIAAVARLDAEIEQAKGLEKIIESSARVRERDLRLRVSM